MKLFTSIAVEISAACNRRCVFCPVSTHKRDEELMDAWRYDAILSQLAELNYSGRMEFYLYNEPFKNREWLGECVRKASAALPSATLMLSTNGDYLKSERDLAWIYEQGLQQVVLNAYHPNRLPLYKEWEAKLRAAMPFLGEDVYAPLPRKRTALKVYDKTSVDGFGTGVFALQNRAGNIPDFMPAASEPVQRMCVKPFRMLNINWRGEAHLCCNDYHADVVCGNVPEQHVRDVWFGPVLAAYRNHLRRKERSLPLCRSCDCHAGARPGNIVREAEAGAALPETIETDYAARRALHS